MITKEEFVKSLNKLKEQSDIDHQFNYHMEHRHFQAAMHQYIIMYCGN